MSSFPLRPAAAIVCLVALGCGSHQVRLMTPHTSPGPRYVCQGEGECQPATTDVPADLNPSGTAFVTLPRECAGRIHQIVIFEAGSSKPKVDVTCAPPEDPIGTMGDPQN